MKCYLCCKNIVQEPFCLFSSPVLKNHFSNYYHINCSKLMENRVKFENRLKALQHQIVLNEMEICLIKGLEWEAKLAEIKEEDI